MSRLGGSLNVEDALDIVDDVIKNFAQESGKGPVEPILPPPHSIEKNVKIHDRGATKKKDAAWEYDTPAEIGRPLKKAKAQATKQAALQVDGVNCTTDTWQTLDLQIQRHYTTFFNLKR